jgi:hypothetical protein
MRRRAIKLSLALSVVILILSAELFNAASGQGGAARRDSTPKADSATQAETSPAEARAESAKQYLIKKRSVAPSRLVVLNGGYRDEMTIELWIVPQGATPPNGTPFGKTQQARGNYLNSDLITYRRMNVAWTGGQLSATLTATPQTISPCPPVTVSTTCPNSGSGQIQLKAGVSNSSGAALRYSYSVTGGRISGEGPEVKWELGGLAEGTYTATVRVDERGGNRTTASTSVSVRPCSDCRPIDLPCPRADIVCPEAAVEVGTPITFTATVSGGEPSVNPTYNWTVSGGVITSGQGTAAITVDTTGLQGRKSITATVRLGGYNEACSQSFICTTPLKSPPPVPRLYTQYGSIAFSDEKRLLDNFYILLQNEPGAQGYIIAYNARPSRAR